MELTNEEKIKMMENRYCTNCGKEDDFKYIRATAAPRHDCCTRHYTCGYCGEKLSFMEPKDTP